MTPGSINGVNWKTDLTHGMLFCLLMKLLFDEQEAFLFIRLNILFKEKVLVSFYKRLEKLLSYF
jgi:hypothetical protein